MRNRFSHMKDHELRHAIRQRRDAVHPLAINSRTAMQAELARREVTRTTTPSRVAVETTAAVDTSDLAQLRAEDAAIRTVLTTWGVLTNEDDDSDRDDAFHEAILDSGAWRLARDLRAALNPTVDSESAGEQR